jgi:hypothetical protein
MFNGLDGWIIKDIFYEGESIKHILQNGNDYVRITLQQDKSYNCYHVKPIMTTIWADDHS